MTVKKPVKRVTIVMDDDVHKKLRTMQSKFIQDTQTNYSFSKIVGLTIRKSFSQYPK